MEKTLYQKARNSVRGLVLAGLVGSVGVQIGKNILEDAKFERTRREVQLLIDTDRNRVITLEEWAPVYEFLGVEPKTIVALGPNGFPEVSYGHDLTNSQLKQYLEYTRGISQ